MKRRFIGVIFIIAIAVVVLAIDGCVPSIAVSTNPATNITTDSAILNGNLASLGTASSVWVSFQWATDAYYMSNGNTYGDETSDQAITTTGLFSKNLSGLLPGTMYHYRVKVVGQGSAYGSDTTFTTGTSSPPQTATFVVAARNASAAEKAQAAYVCTGTNDQATIQAAIDALSTTGGTVHLTEGNFSISTRIAINVGSVTLQGSGWGTVLVSTLTGNSSGVVGIGTSSATNHVIISDLAIDGALRGTSNDGAQIMGGSSNVVIEKLYVYNCSGTGIGVYQATGWRVIDNYVVGCYKGINPNGNATSQGVVSLNHIQGTTGNNAIEVDDACYDIAVSSNTIIHGIEATEDGAGISIHHHEDTQGPHNISVVGNTITVTNNPSYTENGIRVQAVSGSGTFPYDITISDNAIHMPMPMTVTGKGIELSGSSHVTVSGNAIYGASRGIRIEMGVGGDVASYNIIVGNTIRDPYYTGIDTDGGTYNTIEDNMVMDDGTGGPTYGIREYGGGDYNTIIGNIISISGATANISVAGTHTIVRNNQGFNPTGKITNPVGTGTLGLAGGGNTISPSTDYIIIGVDCFVNSSGGTGVSITVKDNAGNTIQSGLSNLTQMWLPIGYKLNFGAFSVAPTVTMFGN